MVNLMSDMLEDVELASKTTMRVGGRARYYADLKTEAELPQLLLWAKEKKIPVAILGGGSNTIVGDAGFPGLVVRMCTTGVEIVEDAVSYVICRLAAGEDWDQFVRWSVKSGFWGVENMSYIPGTAGALAIQNVGAYGQEACDVVVSVEAYDRVADKMVVISAAECDFSYRKSIFNTTNIGRYVILHVFLKLKRNGSPNLSYRSLYFELEKNRIGSLSAWRMWKCRVLSKFPFLRREGCYDLDTLRSTVIGLRKDGRLPDPQKIGSAGSFFKSVTLSADDYEQLLRKAGAISDEFEKRLSMCGMRRAMNSAVKIPAAVLIKGCELGDACCGGASLYEGNPIVVINTVGEATASDICNLRKFVADVVYDKTGVELEVEPRFLGSND